MPHTTLPHGDDPFDLQRFVDAQADVHDQVRAELAAGCKRTHWMWFTFPQLRGLGSSAMADRYGLGGIDEASAYLRHPLLGTRLRDLCVLVLESDVPTATLFGAPDDLKFHACVTLFEVADASDGVFSALVARRFDGDRHAPTLSRLADPGAHDVLPAS